MFECMKVCIFAYPFVFLHVYIYMCVCVCVCVCDGRPQRSAQRTEADGKETTDGDGSRNENKPHSLYIKQAIDRMKLTAWFWAKCGT